MHAAKLLQGTHRHTTWKLVSLRGVRVSAAGEIAHACQHGAAQAAKGSLRGHFHRAILVMKVPSL